MLRLIIPATEQYDEVNNEFVTSKEKILQLEHSLVSISKWESKWKKPFLSEEPKTSDEFIDYIKCMTITQNIDDIIYNFLTVNNIKEVDEYIGDKMTATTFGDDKNKEKNKEINTSELLYYYMIALDIPFECQKWHLNRLITLIQICSIKNKPTKGINKQDLIQRNKSLNAARRAKYNSRG